MSQNGIKKSNRIFLDTEFIEDGTTIEPLSLALLTESGDCLYIVVTDTDRSKANQFVIDHVIPHLDTDPSVIIREDKLTYLRLQRSEVGSAVLSWVQSVIPSGIPEFWAYYGAYDWVLFCQLFGNMTDVPHEWPRYINDLKQHVTQLQVQLVKVNLGGLPEHHAVADAVIEMVQFQNLTHTFNEHYTKALGVEQRKETK